MDSSPAPDTADEPDYAAVLAEVPPGHRLDGWTGERRIAFLTALWNGANVAEAARHVGMSPQTARRLRHRAPAFRAAWDEAQALVVQELADTAIDRAMHGTVQPIYQRGRMVGSRIVHHDQLLIHLLALRDPENFAPLSERERWAALRRGSNTEGHTSREHGSD
jgi:hypothetical protein